jgi:DNA-binding transcriptional regulator YdaS (Cro superfamily)
MSDDFSLTKQQAIELFGTGTALADSLGISKGAVSQWPDDKPIPKEHALNIRFVLKPDSFKAAS